MSMCHSYYSTNFANYCAVIHNWSRTVNDTVQHSVIHSSGMQNGIEILIKQWPALHTQDSTHKMLTHFAQRSRHRITNTFAKLHLCS